MDWIKLLDQIDSFIWGPPLLILLVGTGVFLSFRLKFLQVFRLPFALKLIFKAENDGTGDVNSFGALCTALAATIGTGNIIGVATAIKAGGPGALFWMWMAAFFGMATKYGEGLLAIKYRSKDANGQIAGGPMHYILKGMGEKFRPLAVFFAVSGVLVALLGIGTFPQVNAIVSSINGTFGIPAEVSGILLTILVALIVIGGLKSIANVSTKVIPFMSVLYVTICLVVVFTSFDKIPQAVNLVISNAFTGTAAVGGFLGATMQMAVRNGVARGVFSNESGLGSAPIAAAAAKTKWPAEQGLISMTGTFIDTIIVCTLTGLSIVVTGVWQTDLQGTELTSAAFGTVMPVLGPVLLTLSLALFAFTTIIGWNYYGERCCEFLFGVKSIMPYRIVFIAMVALGAFIKLEAIWLIADIVNGLMALPNLIALVCLSGVIAAETKLYVKHLKKESGKIRSVGSGTRI
ncbi:sodium:alanine symporter family protein [Clostridium thermosuccinogenes]|uniref:Sodium:alanine symporter family protein n=1 Tax=Clostridium thermosuccinogenes TaxID=84032 RepID=A0A2K2FB58_9CLOT|nr:sodium:alanine symporter family protein [Pseudoclostridium thermosuccinogenes]AUS98553.1 sodium:alanine symporter family protein [Pseudoclostridium thermosuccinogenes]PNT95997.1 sodium:alanine symporter family protein [Pseudoclostridium thermosuccinogenes]PNT97424.1 sodium:alanine symporter family protein [Pseudoclostridium thermosuccinogenes]